MQSHRRGQLVGLAGSVLLALSAWLASPWGLGFAGRFNPLWLRWVHTTPAVAGVVLLFCGWMMLRGAQKATIWRTFALWAFQLMLCPPLLSKDVWAYLEQGWLVLQGQDPYTSALGTIGGPFANRVDYFWMYTTTVYPPLALQIQAAMVALGGASPVWSLFTMRIPGLLAAIVIGLCLPRLGKLSGRDPGDVVWFGLLNPLIIVHFIGGGHNDAWATACGVFGIWLAVRKKRLWPVGCVFVGFAMAIKQPLGLMMVAVCLVGVAVTDPGLTSRQAWRQIIGKVLWRMPLGLVLTLAGFAVPHLVTGWGLGWANGSGSPQSAGSQSIAHTVAATIEMLTGLKYPAVMSVVSIVFLGIGAIAIVWLGWRLAPRQPIAFTAWALLIFAFSYPSLQPWYPLWGCVLLATVVLGRRQSAWIIAGTAGLLTTNTFLDYGGLWIPFGQGVAVAVAVILGVWNLKGQIRGIDWPFATNVEGTCGG